MNRHLLIGGAIVVLIGIFLWVSRSELFGTPSAKSQSLEMSIAVVENVVGRANVKNSQDEITTLSPQTKIFENNTLMTDENGVVIFKLVSGAKFQMAPLTKVIFQKMTGLAPANILITILEGEIQLLDGQADPHSFEVSKQGKSLTIEELKTDFSNVKPALPEDSQIKSTEQITVAADKPQKTKLKIKDQSNHDSLNQEDINKVMRNQTSFLHRCYINYMLRTQNLDLKGEVVLSFVIEPSGKVSSSKVISSPTHDDQLDRCLTDVIARASFREFSSQAIIVQAYPIHLD